MRRFILCIGLVRREFMPVGNYWFTAIRLAEAWLQAKYKIEIRKNCQKD